MAELTVEKFEERMDSFAKTVKEGFDATVSKEDLRATREDLKTDIKRLDERLRNVESTMVTKVYLDDKLSDLRGDLVVLLRKEDGKLLKLVEKLRLKRLLDDADAEEITGMEPFPALRLSGPTP